MVSLASHCLKHPTSAYTFMSRADIDRNIMAERNQTLFEFGLAQPIEFASRQPGKLWLRNAHFERGIALAEPKLVDRLGNTDSKLGLDDEPRVEAQIVENAHAGRRGVTDSHI
jgi:hypothetical protein